MDRNALAVQVVDLARARVLSKNHFLSAAVGRLGLEAAVLGEQFVTDGYELYFDPSRVISSFRAAGVPPEHDLLHCVAHCLFLHPFVGPSVNRRYWDLACDIVAERVVSELIGPRPGQRGAHLAVLLGRIQGQFRERVSAEALYASFCSGDWEGDFDSCASAFHSDDHTAWYAFRGSEDSDEGRSGSESGEGGRFKADSDETREGGVSEGAAGSGRGMPDPGADGSGGESADQQVSPGAPSEGDPARQDGSGAAEGRGNRAGDRGDSYGLSGEGLRMRSLARPDARAQMEAWRQVAVALSVNLKTMGARQGDEVPGFVEDLGRVSQKREDYESFLRRFATLGEVMRLSDDEFDSIFYTFGMKVYGNMPLIEPLEYREEKRVREFVIVIDSSGSVSGDAVRAFVDTTFSILRSTESFFERVHLRIIQCDAQVQSDDRIDSLDELARWSSQVKVYGGGGTDFRPAFAYVDSLVENGEFANLGGLVYFTDGQGVYPEWMPSYRTAFVFYGEGHLSQEVPPWAVQMVLDSQALGDGVAESMQGVVR